MSFNRLKNIQWGNKGSNSAAKKESWRKATFGDYGDEKDWKALSDACKRRDNYTCQKCKRYFPKGTRNRLHAHHKISRSKWGKNKLSNLITYCHECHSGEHTHMRKVVISDDFLKNKPNFNARKFFGRKNKTW